MALIKRTVGVGGDHADWSAAWIYLTGLDPLPDDYEFKQISNCTINNSWPDTTLAPNRIDLNGHYVKFYCPRADSHQGDPTRGYMTYLNGATGYMDLVPGDTSVLNQDRIYVENLNIIQTTNNNVDLVRVGLLWNCWGVGANFYFNNLLIKGFSPAWATGLRLYHLDSIYKVSNCKIWSVNVGISCFQTAEGPAAIPRTEANEIENVTVYDTSNATGGMQYRSGDTRRFEYRSVVSCNNAVGVAWNTSCTSAVNVFYNCADDDGAIANIAWTGANNAVDCISNIGLADSFRSLVDTESDFLKLPAGSANASGSASPVRGLAPLDVKFSSALQFVSDSILGKTGIRPTLQLTDISGNARPGDDNLYSIGASEVQYDYDSN